LYTKSAYLLNFGYKGLCLQLTLWLQNDIIVYDVDAIHVSSDGVRLHMGKRLHTAITIWKVWKNLQRATKMATETGGGILFITEEFSECEDNKVN
jgi:glycine C-acetyltransferase